MREGRRGGRRRVAGWVRRVERGGERGRKPLSARERGEGGARRARDGRVRWRSAAPPRLCPAPTSPAPLRLGSGSHPLPLQERAERVVVAPLRAQRGEGGARRISGGRVRCLFGA